MRIVYAPTKDATNQEKHGISLAEAAHLDWDKILVWEDNRRDYGEVRQVALAVLGERVYVVVFVERTDGRRIISLRKANAREVIRYLEEFKDED
ncbi:MAG: BrnT family toxin [Magnetococcales bacterium]|nr:BrnT family toxin [Magnetococcales bacterium]